MKTKNFPFQTVKTTNCNVTLLMQVIFTFTWNTYYYKNTKT